MLVIKIQLLKKKHQWLFKTKVINIMNYQMTSYQIKDRILYLNFQDLPLKI